MYSIRCNCPILMKLEFSRQIFEKKNTQIQNFMKIRPEGAEFHADRRTDRHDEATATCLLPEAD